MVMKIILGIIAVVIIAAIGVLYIEPVWYQEMKRGQCLDGGTSYFVDNKDTDKEWFKYGRSAIGLINECHGKSYIFNREIVSRWKFYREMNKYNQTCNGCLVQTPSHGMT